MPAVLYETHDRIARITLNRPEALNAFNRDMHAELREAWLAFREDDDLWVAIVSAAGDRAFSAGADVKEMGQRREDAQRRSFWEQWSGQNLQNGLEVWKPTIAAIDGYCLGEGLTLAMSCDFRIASERASFGFPEVNIGIATIVGAVRAPRIVGLGNALELLLIGERVDASRAYQMGLLTRVVQPERLRDEAEALALRLCRNGPLAVRATKEVIYRSQNMAFGDAVRMGESLRRLVNATEDAREGPRAFQEKREAQFKGR
jgi:enoyl-CoA hydratase/carnithine racemase